MLAEKPRELPVPVPTNAGGLSYFDALTGAASHRSLSTFTLRPRDALNGFALTGMLSLGLLFLLPYLGSFWQRCFDLGIAWLKLPYPTDCLVYDMGDWVSFQIPYVLVSSPYPSGSTLLEVTGLTALLALMSFFLSAERVPLRYGLRVLAAMQGSALFYFWTFPHDFPYPLTDYLLSMMKVNLAFMVLIPWMLGTTYFIFGFSTRRKLLFSLMVLGYFVVEIPFQYLMQLWLIHRLSLVVAPALFVLFGLSFQIFLFMALYAWAMSWD